ncbi:hypothetical protein M8C21_011133 [Ambrosia artemisiifolia]|uniref:Cytochrome P450 n=1 Tax=Ambrosia artemisiifolia TaxID=4212 RepID=A0AAD5CBK3_AMBAR|nr:hypothetical protein M8C21_011133 [Ambrosia artemisiifolia]
MKPINAHGTTPNISIEFAFFTMEINLLTSLLLFAAPFLFFVIRKYSTSVNKNLPPGPRPLPIIGNMHQMAKDPHIVAANFAKKYGPLISLRLGTRFLVVASSPEAAKEVLKTQDRYLSGRSIPDALQQSFIDYYLIWARDCNEHWKLCRTLCRAEFDFFPIVGALDLQGLRKDSLNQHDVLSSFSEAIVKERRARIAKNMVLEDHEKDFLDLLLENNFTNAQINILVLDLCVAGTDTVVTTIEWAMAELIKNQNIMHKVQEELKRELSSKSIMNFDLSKLTYFNACIKETLRLHPAVPVLIPRRAIEACEVMNYTIPQNSQVWVNVWAIGHDPKVWEDPNAFKPERFLGSNIDFTGHDYEFIPFGGGRRMCPGLLSGVKSLQTILAPLILEYDWSLPYNEDPAKLDMTEKFGVTLQKEKPLELIFKRRE